MIQKKFFLNLPIIPSVKKIIYDIIIKVKNNEKNYRVFSLCFINKKYKNIKI